MSKRNIHPVRATGDLKHPPSCACLKCAAGRKSLLLDAEMRKKLYDALDVAFIQTVHRNFLGGFQALAQGQPLEAVHSSFLTHMGSIEKMREIAAAYFAEEKSDGDLRQTTNCSV